MRRQLSVCLMIILGCGAGFSQSKTKRNRPAVRGPQMSEGQCSLGTADFSSPIGSIAHKNNPDPVSSTSADTYGQNNLCLSFREYYQVEATGTQGLNIMMEGISGDDHGNPKPNSRSDCQTNTVSLKFWGYDAAGWHNLGALSASGVWNRQTNVCSVYGSKLIQSSPYSKLRVLAKATKSTLTGPVSRKVTAVLDNVQW